MQCPNCGSPMMLMPHPIYMTEVWMCGALYCAAPPTPYPVEQPRESERDKDKDEE